MNVLRKYISMFLTVILLVLMPVNRYMTIVSYADGVSYDNPLFIPFTTLVTSALIGAGIIGKNAVDASNELVQSVSKRVQEKAIQKALENDESPFRVVTNGQPQKPNNDNKNGKWFAVGATTALGTGLACEKGAVEMILDTANELGGFNKYQNNVNTIDISEFEKESSASNISLQLAKVSNLAVSQFDLFLHSSWWNDKDFTPDDCLFLVNVYLIDVLAEKPKYPQMTVRVIPKNNISKIRVINDILEYGKFSNSYGSLSVWYTIFGHNVYQFLNNESEPIKTNIYTLGIRSKDTNSDVTFYRNSYVNDNQTPIIMVGGSANLGGTSYPYFGYVYKTFTPWEFTQNVYNYNQTLEVQFPDWLQPTLNILGQQLQGIQIGIDSIQPSWQPTQQEVQSGEAPTNIINQYINYYENPADIPSDVEPEPEPDPDPDPEPAPSISEPIPTDEYLDHFLLPESITTKFPFCIPFDVARALRLFSVSQREAPKWECDLNYGSNTYHVVIDLAMFNDVASFIRPLEFILFLVGLTLGTRSLIRG